MGNKWEANESFKIKYCLRRNHCYDISKRGYINFVQKVSMKIYNAELFEHRRLVYNSGFYEQLIETMDLLVTTYICHRGVSTIVDAGCGEGTFITKLCSRNKDKKP